MSTTIYLNGVNINRYVVLNSLNIDDAIGERSTCQFDVKCPAGALNLVAGARVEVYTDNIKIFGGTIDNIDKVELLGTNPRYLEYSIQCTDWHQICDRRIVSEAYENMSAGSIVQDIIKNYLGAEGIIGNPADPTFTRSSVAYLSDGTQVAANVPRQPASMPGFGQAQLIEEGTTNELTNPSFETDLTGWSNTGDHPPTSERDTTEKYIGNASAKVTFTGSNSVFAQSLISKKASLSGVTFTISAWVKTTATDVRIGIQTNYSNLTGNTAYSSWHPGDGQWHRLSVTATLTFDVGGTTTYIIVGVIGNTAGTVAYVDGFLVEKKPYPTSFIDGTRSPESLTIPTAGVLNPQEGTVECWVYVNSSLKENSTYRHIFSVRHASGADDAIVFFHDIAVIGNRFRFKTTNSSGSATNIVVADSEVPDGWRLFTLRWSPSRLSIFVDGVEKAYAINPYLPSQLATDMWIGHEAGAGHCNTFIDDLRISNRARTGEEIAAAYQSGQPLPVDEWTTYKLNFDGDIKNSAIPIQDGPIVQQAVFNYVPATQCFDKLADLADFMWWIDSNKILHFCDRTLYQAPLSLKENTAIFNPKLSSNRDNYRNRQYIRAGKGTTDPQTETFKGDGVQKTFTVGFPIAKVPTVLVNGVQKTVGIKSVDTGKDWYWNKGDPVLTQDSAATPLAATDTLTVTYQGLYDVIVLTDDYAAIEDRKNIEGGTGWYEAVDEEPYLVTSDAAFQSANALLKKYAKLGQVLTFDTLLTGLHAGQLLQVNLSALGAVGEYLIRKVQYRDIQGSQYDYIFSIEAVSCFAADTWTKFFKTNLGQLKTYVIRENIQEQEVLIRLVQQSENTSWSEITTQTLFACPVPSDNLYPSDTLYPC